MINSISLENFKAFGKRVKIPLAPITLIFGQNSAGKSSILQALNLLKQTREAREPGVLLVPRTEKGIVDLGSFQDMIFDHKLKKKFSILIDFSIADSRLQDFFRRIAKQEVETLSYEISIKRPSIKEEISLDKIGISTTLNNQNVELATFKPTEIAPAKAKREMFWGFSRERRLLNASQLSMMYCASITENISIWKPSFEYFIKNKSKFTKYLQLKLKTKDDLGLFNAERRGIKKKLLFEEAIEFYSSNFSIEQYIARMRKNQLKTIIGMDGFIPISVSLEEKYFEEEFVRRSIIPTESFFEIGRLAIWAGRQMEHVLSSVFPLGAYRRPPERWYIYTGSSPKDVGYHGELLPDLLYRQSSLVEKTNQWLNKLEIGYKLKVESLGPRMKDLFELKLLDTRRSKEVEVGLKDVGFGVSQILPFIVQSLASKNEIISIEQPEVHIHPKLQADIGDLISQSIKEPNFNRFIIETHSEHLILRLQKLIRNKIIKPTDVSVIYVQRNQKGSKINKLNIDDEGDFIDQWPEGFFPERLRELRVGD